MALPRLKSDSGPGAGGGGRPAAAVLWIHWAAAAVGALWAVYAWASSGGFPYIKDGNESALSFVHALNLYHFNPFSTGFVTTYDTELGKAAVNSTLIYAHNPNFPRYVHYLLLLSGIRSFTTQVLLITVPVTVLNVLSVGWFFLSLLENRRFSHWLALVAVCATLSDYIGFLAYTVNTYRTFVFCLFWLSLLGMLRPWRWWRVSLVFFALYQLEYGFAIFVFVSAMALLAATPRPRRLVTACAALGGALASLALFSIQLFASGAFSVPALVLEFQRTTERRGGAHFAQYFTETVPAIGAKLGAINSPILNLILAWALVSSIAVVVWSAAASGPYPRVCAGRLGLSRFFLAMTIGAMGASAELTDYILEAYLGSMLPFLTFFTATAITIAVSDLFSIAALLPRKPAFFRGFAGFAAACLVMTPLIRQSIRWRREYPGLSGGYVEVLKEHFRGKPILVMGHFNQLPTALTEGPTLQMKYEEPDVVTADFSRFDRFRNEKGELVFLGLGLGWVGLDSVVARLKAKGDEILYRGADFALVGLRDPRFPDTSNAPDPGAAFGSVELRVRFPTSSPGAIEPVLGCGRLREGVLVYVTYVDMSHIRVGLDAGPRGAALSPAIPIDYGAVHEIEISHGGLFPAEGRAKLTAGQARLLPALRAQARVGLDHKTVFEVTLPLLAAPPSTVRIGEKPELFEFPCGVRFTGKVLGQERIWPAAFNPFRRDVSLGAGDYGCVGMDVVFPKSPMRQPEPLLVTGVSGAGDFIYIEYLDGSHVQFGFDHWGVRGRRGPVLSTVPGLRHRISISIGSLFPPAGDRLFGARSEREVARLKNRVLVTCDGVEALEAASDCYESPPMDVEIGLNQIGGSTCGSGFSGRLMDPTRFWP